MSGVICDTTGLTKVPPKVFHINSDTIDCSETVKIDEDAVKELMESIIALQFCRTVWEILQLVQIWTFNHFKYRRTLI